MADLPHLHLGGRVLDANLHLLDRQVLDADGVPVGVVDDVELRDVTGGGRGPTVVGLVVGGGLLTRVFGGRGPITPRHRIGWRDVAAIDTAVHLGRRAENLPIAWADRWVRERIIGRLPGGRHAPR